MIWFWAVIDTASLILLTLSISMLIGFFSATLAWRCNRWWAYILPVVGISVPPWLLSYQISDVFGYINPWLGASLSLGLTCSVYAHAIIASSLANRGHSTWEMLRVTNGDSIKTIWIAVWPSLKVSIAPSIAVISAEVIADFGVSNFHGINSITMLSYNIWTSTWNFTSLIPGLVVLAIAGSLLASLKTKSGFLSIGGLRPGQTWYGLLALTPTLILLTFSLGVSVHWTLDSTTVYTDLLYEFINSITLVSVVILLCLVSIILFVGNYGKQTLSRIGTFSYALPGTVVGASLIYLLGGIVPLFILLVLGVAFRYFGLIVNSIMVADISSARYYEVIDVYVSDKFSRIKQKLGLLAPSLVIGVCLIILDVLRELPISLILQPMNFQTLAMRLSYLSKTEELSDLGPHSMLLLILSIITATILIFSLYANYKKSKIQST